jgi:MOSC domain-containing protein YiiM
MTGRVLQINVKPKTTGEHGLGKRPVESVRVGFDGLDGDYNTYRQERLDGDPDSAVMIMTREMIDELNSEGWPIEYGDIGENILAEGIPYDNFSPGCRFRIGGIIVQIARTCDPCRNLYSLPYVGTEKGPRFLRTLLGRRGWYARVIQEGIVRKSDTIEPVD